MFYTILTDIGKAKIANATALGTVVQLTHIAVGDGNGIAIVPDQTDNVLANEVWRAALNSINVDPANPDWIVAEGYIPSTDGGFTVREVGLFDLVGDMIAVGSYPDTYKPTLASGSAKDLYIKVIIEVSSASSVELKIDPAVVLASRAFTDATYLKKDGDQTKTGTLTLVSSPIIPDPTAAQHATSKNYVDKKGLENTSGFIKPTGDSVLFTKASVSSITIPVGTKILAGANIIEVLTTAYTLSLNSVGVGALDTGTKAAGTDYYVYALEAGGFIVSANATNPTGYTTANSRKIGGFHYGVIPEAFTAINNITASDATKIAGINSYTFWDLKFMPVNGDPRGMFFANSKWYDLYLCNTDHHLYGTSAAGKTIAGGTILNGRTYPKIPLFYGGDGTVTYGTFTWFESAELGAAYGKEQLSYDEFVAVSYGVLEASSASTADTGVTQHLANYTSKFGMCMATGCQYIWSRNVFSDTSGTYVWQAITEGRGSVYSVGTNPKAALLGGDRGLVANSGSRASHWSSHVWYASWNLGARFACGHLVRA